MATTNETMARAAERAARFGYAVFVYSNGRRDLLLCGTEAPPKGFHLRATVLRDGSCALT